MSASDRVRVKYRCMQCDYQGTVMIAPGDSNGSIRYCCDDCGQVTKCKTFSPDWW